MIIAQYTIRSKQDYIFRSNRIVEITGASEHISRSWDILCECAERAGVKIKKLSEDFHFSLKAAEQDFSSGIIQMVELFRGGGNETALFDNFYTYKKVNKAFSFYLLNNYPGMIPMAVCTECTGDYEKDYADLMRLAESEKNKMTTGQSSFILPFSMMDRSTYIPYCGVMAIKGDEVRVTAENYKKRVTGLKIREKNESVKFLDDMVTGHDEESLLAVVHADGNNMGSKISVMLRDQTDYDYCVTRMREFTAVTADAFITEGQEALDDCRQHLMEKYKEKKIRKSAFAYRKIISDGDDMTFICNARFVMEYVQAYLKSVQNYKKRHGSEFDYSSCAGICIFHSHYPFARAYSMAEQACDDGAKQKVHVAGKTIEESWVDFHYIHSGIGGNLMNIREEQGTADRMARPLCVCGNNTSLQTYENLEKLMLLFKQYQVSRSDIKAIGSEYESSLADGKGELIRIGGHHKGLIDKLKELFPNEDIRMKMIYDLSEVYDLWFKEA